MALLSRWGQTLLVIQAVILLFAVILSTYYTLPDPRVVFIGHDPLLLNYGYKINDGHSTKKVKDEDEKFKMISKHDHPDTGEQVLTGMESNMVKRKQQMKMACASMKNKMSLFNQQLYQDEVLKHLTVNEEKAAIYCHLPNTANTNFRRVFLGLPNVTAKSNMLQVGGYDVYFTHSKRFKVKYLNQFKPDTQSNLLRTYKKILVVRDPLERLLQGYVDRFLHANALRKEEYHSKVANFYERHPDLHVKNNMRVKFCLQEISFKEFLIYFCDVYETKEYLNEHFAPSYQLCNPCSIQYDYIGKYETLSTDAAHIFTELNITTNFQNNLFLDSKGTLVKKHYKLIPGWLLRKTWNVLQFDYYIFGYKLPIWYKEKMREK